MKLKKFLSILLLGGMVASSIPTYALVDKSKEDIEQISRLCWCQHVELSYDEMLEHLSKLYDIIPEAVIDNDSVVLDELKILLNNLTSKVSKEDMGTYEKIIALITAMVNYCSFNKLLIKLNEFTLEEYTECTSKLSESISIKSILDLVLGMKLEKSSKILIQGLSCFVIKERKFKVKEIELYRKHSELR